MGILSIVVWCLVIGFIIFILRKYFNGPKTPNTKSLDGKIIIVTGSNTGIGRETALDLLEKGARVIFACRDENKTNQVLQTLVKDQKKSQNAIFIKVDLGNFDSINKFVSEFRKSIGSFDCLVNNAGSMFDEFSTQEKIETTIMVNHVGPVYLTSLLLPMINRDGIIINVSSMGHTLVTSERFSEFLKEIEFSESKAKYSPISYYSFSKLCNVLHASALDNYARKSNISFKTASLHPGAVTTDFQKRFNTLFYKILSYILFPFQFIFFKDSKMGAQTTLHIVYSDYRTLNSAAYFSDCAEAPKSQVAADPQNVKKLMDYTMKLIYNNLPQVPKEVDNFFKSIN